MLLRSLLTQPLHSHPDWQLLQQLPLRKGRNHRCPHRHHPLSERPETALFEVPTIAGQVIPVRSSS